MLVTEAFRRVPLFSQLGNAELARLAHAAHEKSYAKDQPVFFEADPGDALYVVLTGQVRVVMIGEDGREVILALLRVGDFFGEMALLDDAPRSAHVITMEPSTLLLLRREDFRRCLHETPSIADGLLRELSRRLRQADSKIRGFAFLNADARVADVLLSMADKSDGVTISQPVSRRILAQLVGASRETVSRAFSEFSKQGLIQVSRGAILIRDRGALEAAAGRHGSR